MRSNNAVGQGFEYWCYLKRVKTKVAASHGCTKPTNPKESFFVFVLIKFEIHWPVAQSSCKWKIDGEAEVSKALLLFLF